MRTFGNNIFIKIQPYYYVRNEDYKPMIYEVLLNINDIQEIVLNENGLYSIISSTGNRLAKGKDLDILFGKKED